MYSLLYIIICISIVYSNSYEEAESKKSSVCIKDRKSIIELQLSEISRP